METNCNQMAAMQRNGRYSSNVNCNCSMNSNAAMGKSGYNQRCRMQDNRSCDGRYERQETGSYGRGCERQDRRNCERGCEKNERKNCDKSCERHEREDCERRCEKKEIKSCEKGCEKRENRSCNVGCGSSKTVQDDMGRSMEVECVCKVKTANNCHKDDPMEKLGSRFPVAMAYVPWQQWGELYDAECGLMQGTIFKDLNKIFCGVR